MESENVEPEANIALQETQHSGIVFNILLRPDLNGEEALQLPECRNTQQERTFPIMLAQLRR